MNTTLKPCPFCGGEAYSETYANGEGNIVDSHKPGCYMLDFGNVCDMEEAELQEAIEAWNTRAEHTYSQSGLIGVSASYLTIDELEDWRNA